MMDRKAIQLVIFAIFLISTNCLAFTGKVVGVADGDTITVRTSRGDVRVRLYGIDTPEKRQAFGNKAKKLTNSLVRGRTVIVRAMDRDRYGRTVGIVYADGINVNETIIRNGFAWVYQRYCHADFCMDWKRYERQARTLKKGMWASPHNVPPWEWRHNGRKKKTYAQILTERWNSYRPSPPSSKKGYGSGEYHGNVKSRKFHRPGCRSYNCKNCVAGFPTRDAAISAGYSPCSLCNP